MKVVLDVNERVKEWTVSVRELRLKVRGVGGGGTTLTGRLQLLFENIRYRILMKGRE